MPKYVNKDFGGFDLSDIFTYDPETGIVRHNPDRPADTFKTGKGFNFWVAKYSNKPSGYMMGTGYLMTCFTLRGMEYKELNHRLALYLSGVIVPNGMCVDHVDGDRLNNKLSNLRVVTVQNNIRNSRLSSNSTSSVMGLCWHKRAKKWQVSIMVDRKSIYLGLYEDKDEAIKVRKEAEVKYGFHANHGRD